MTHVSSSSHDTCILLLIHTCKDTLCTPMHRHTQPQSRDYGGEGGGNNLATMRNSLSLIVNKLFSLSLSLSLSFSHAHIRSHSSHPITHSSFRYSCHVVPARGVGTGCRHGVAPKARYHTHKKGTTTSCTPVRRNLAYRVYPPMGDTSRTPSNGGQEGVSKVASCLAC